MSKSTNNALPKGHKIGLYVRVSTEEAAKNPEGSIKSQEQRLRTHVAMKNQEGLFGEVVAVFVDAAKSGKDTNRPELQKLLKAIREKDVTMVLVSELSRLSRSIRDFCDMWEMMRAHQCQFQSLREQFDTTTAAGEMVLYTIANIAQFERKQTSERLLANFRARAERGLWNGGSVPFGYTRHPEKKGYLIVKGEEAAIVREAFNTFLLEGTLANTGKSLNDRGYRMPQKRECGGDKPRHGYFMIDNLYEMLINRAYIGLRVYQANGEEKTSHAVWPGIIDEKIFSKVQEGLKANYRRRKKQANNRYPFLLAGLCVCGQCGDRLPGKSAWGNGGKIPYYEHGWATKRQAYLNQKIFTCNPHRIQAKKLEPLVWEEVTKLLTEPQMSEAIIIEAHKVHATKNHVPETDRLRSRVRGIEEQIEALAEHLSKIPKAVSPAPVFSQMQKLESLKTASQKELEEMANLGYSADEPIALKDYQAYLTAVRNILSFAEAPDLRAKIVQRLVQKVEVLPGSFRVHYYVGKSAFVPIDPEPTPPNEPSGGKNGSKNKMDMIKKGDLPRKEIAPFFALNFGSNTLTKFRGGRI